MQPEILAPAGSMEALRAAVGAGADAVYLGASQYGARAYAQNFGGDELREAVHYCHLWGVKVYVTVNTLVTDRELCGMTDFIRELCDLGVDAAIVQDLGVAALVRRLAPQLSLHGSTQMTLCNLDGVREAERLGMKRVVLARELTAGQVRHIAENTALELELFVHGSLCVCYSGRCYMSSVLGRRSGNRGRCAQPCRLSYELNGTAGPLLSLRDLSLLPLIDQVARLGVTSLKIEGRMKRPEYVSAVTRILARSLKQNTPPPPEDLELLQTLYSRSGFTDGYFTGRHAGMHGARLQPEGEYEGILEKERLIIRELERTPRIPLRMEFLATPGEPLRLTLRAGGCTVLMEDAPPQPAQTRPTAPEEAREALTKLGGTPYYLEQYLGSVAEGLYLPRARLNGLRRRALEHLEERRLAPHHPFYGERAFLPPEINGQKRRPALRAVFSAANQIPSWLLTGPPDWLEGVYLPLDELLKHPELPGTLGVRLPPLWTDQEQQQLEPQLLRLRERGVRRALCQNLGQLHLAQELGFALDGDCALNLFNTESLRVLTGRGLASATLSFELNLPQIRDLEKPIPCGILAYGRLELMLTATCASDGSSCAVCALPAQLVDRQGERFPLMPAAGCRNLILNSRPVWLADRWEDLEPLGLSFLTLYFTDESPDRVGEVLEAYTAPSDTVRPNSFTRALYYKGVL